VRWLYRMMAVGVLTASLAVPAFADGKKPGEKGFGDATCGDFGTSLRFEKNPKDAATKALKAEKLVLVIHISGYFEEPDYT
jgi:hypothetical protein